MPDDPPAQSPAAPPPRAAAAGEAHTGTLQRRIRRLTRSPHELEAEELLVRSLRAGAVAVASAPLGEPVTVSGTIRSLTLRPRAGVPALEAELYDGSGAASLVFLGRRVIPGITPGRTVVARGRITRRSGRLVIYNPAYQLRAVGD